MSNILAKLGLEPKKETAKAEKKLARKEDGTLKYSKVAYVYGQIFIGYIENDMADKYTIQNVHVREWKKILFFLQREGIIKSFHYGQKPETAANLTITGFDGENLMYENYLKGIIKNMQKEEETELV